MICQDLKKHREKSICILEILATRKQKRKPKYYLFKNLKGAYLGFVPLDLTEMDVSWENGNLFRVKQKEFLIEMSALDAMEQSSWPRNNTEIA
jgi:hypothetical protein